MHRQMAKKQTNRWVILCHFQKETLAIMVIYFPVILSFWGFESGNKKEKVYGQTDIGHTNLTCVLVPCNLLIKTWHKIKIYHRLSDRSLWIYCNGPGLGRGPRIRWPRVRTELIRLSWYSPGQLSSQIQVLMKVQQDQ